MQAGALRRAPAPFAGDDLVGIVSAAHRAGDDRLDDAALTQRSDQLVKLGIGEGAPGIAGVGPWRLAGTRRWPRGRSTEALPATSPINAASPRPSHDRVVSSAIAVFSRP